MKSFSSLISYDIPGKSKDPVKAERMHSFYFPKHFIEPQSSDKDRDANVLFAILSEEANLVIALIDYQCLATVAIVSLDRHWEQTDLEVGKPVSIYTYMKYPEFTIRNYSSGLIYGARNMDQIGLMRQTQLMLSWTDGASSIC